MLGDHALSPWYKVQRRDKKNAARVCEIETILKWSLMYVDVTPCQVEELLSACEPKQLAQQYDKKGRTMKIVQFA